MHALLFLLASTIASDEAKIVIADLVKSQNSLKMARGWSGKLKEALGELTPYKVVEEVQQIPDMAEKALIKDVEEFDFPKDGSLLQKINKLREHFQKQVDSWKSLKFHGMQNECFDIIIQHLSESKMWLGYALQELASKQKA